MAMPLHEQQLLQRNTTDGRTDGFQIPCNTGQIGFRHPEEEVSSILLPVVVALSRTTGLLFIIGGV